MPAYCPSTKHRQHSQRPYIAVLAFGLALLCASATVGQNLTLVSVNSAGSGSGNRVSGDFGRYSINADGRYVLFYSEASDLVPLDASANGDIFVRDLQTGITKLVSVNAAATASGNGISSFGLISADGRYASFTSFANNIVPNDTNTSPDVFLRDLQTSTTKLVSINVAGTGSGSLGGSELIDMSPNGRFITFQSHATDLTTFPDGNGLGTDIYVRDTVNNTTTLVTVNLAGSASGNGTSFGASISADGRYVTFTSESSDLVANDTNTRDVFLRDLQAGVTIRLSTNSAGTAGGNNLSQGGLIDRSGRSVVFATRATDLSPLPDTNELWDIFVFDVQSKTKKLITVNTAGTATGTGFPPGGGGFFDHFFELSITDDGRFVAFMSQLGNLTTNDTNGNGDDIFLYDETTAAKSLVSINLTGTSGLTGGSFKPSISADGRYVAFQSFANDLTNVADEIGGFTTDVYVRDVVAGQTRMASINSAGTRSANGPSFQPFISADGTRLVFNSRATDLIPNDLNGFAEDVFAYTVFSGVAPVLLTEENTENAMALDSVTQMRDPFSLMNPYNFSSDGRTRISLFAWNLDLLPNEDWSVVTAQAEDQQGAVYGLTVEFLGSVGNVSGVKQVVVKLPENLTPPKDVWIKVRLRGIASNKGLLKIKTP